MNTMNRFAFCNIIARTGSHELYKEVLNNSQRYEELAAQGRYELSLAVAEKLKDFDTEDLTELAEKFGYNLKICA